MMKLRILPKSDCPVRHVSKTIWSEVVSPRLIEKKVVLTALIITYIDYRQVRVRDREISLDGFLKLLKGINNRQNVESF